MSRVRRNVRRTIAIAEEHSPMAYRRIDRHPYETETPREEQVPLWVWVLACLALAVVGALLLGAFVQFVTGG